MNKSVTESEQLTLFAPDFLVSHTVLPGSERAIRMTAISGRKLLEFCPKSGRIGLLVKTLLTFSTWGSMDSFLIWKISATRQQRLVFRLTQLVYQRWNGTSGLLPRPMKSDSKGSGYDRYLGSKKCKGNFREVIRDSKEDGIYPNPDFAEWVKGFPIGWTLIQNED